MRPASMTPAYVVMLTALNFHSLTNAELRANAADDVRLSENDWSAWTIWSKCSKSCGMGIMSRTRRCIVSSTACHVEFDKQFQTCNQHACQRDVDGNEFRATQCQRFNNLSFDGIFYQWEPFNRNSANANGTCELSCRPKGLSGLSKVLSSVVIDGMRCRENDPYHICIQGKCTLVGCNGIIGSPAKFDRCGVCEGNNSTCHVISGFFVRTLLPAGYNHITTIPRGACNLNVSQLRADTTNRLAVKLNVAGSKGVKGGGKQDRSYIINGRNGPGASRSGGNEGGREDERYVAAGTIFQYRRQLDTYPDTLGQGQDRGGLSSLPVESIIAAGPLNASIDILLIQREENRGVTYTYTLPTAATSSHSSLPPRHHVRHHHGGYHNNQHPSVHASTRAYVELPIELLRKEHQRETPQSSFEHSDSETARDRASLKSGTSSSGKDERRKMPKDNIYGGGKSALNDNILNVLDDRGLLSDQQADEPRLNELDATEQTRSRNEAYRRQQHELWLRQQREREDQQDVSRGQLEQDGNLRLQYHHQRMRQQQLQQQRQRSTNHTSPHHLASSDGSAVGDNTIDRRYTVRPERNEPVEQDSRSVSAPAKARAGNNSTGGSTRGHRRSSNAQPGVNVGIQGPVVLSPALPAGPMHAPNWPPPPLAAYPVQPHQQPPLYQTQGAAGDNPYRQQYPGYQSPPYTQIPASSSAALAPNYGYSNPNSLPYSYSSSGASYYPDNPPNHEYRSSFEQLPAQDGQPLDVQDYYRVGYPSPARHQLGSERLVIPNGIEGNSQRGIRSERLAGPSDVRYRSSTDYVWKIAGFSECSKTCVGGTQHTLIVCMKITGVQVVVTDDNCDQSRKPKSRTIECNNVPCAPAWEAGDWSDCSTSCDRGQRRRTVECRQRVSSTLSYSVAGSRCHDEPRLETVLTCNDDRPCVRWRVGEWNTCSTECGRGVRTREVACVNIQDRPIAENKCKGSKPSTSEVCDMGTCSDAWFYSQWTENCSGECGEGVHTRGVHCSADVGKRCNALNKPATEKICRNDNPCGGKWFTGSWGECSVTCGVGVMKRDVACMKKAGQVLVVVSSENCVASEEPATDSQCHSPACLPDWYTTDWTECSRSCDTGLRSREVRCLSASGELSQACDSDQRPDHRQPCNINHCSRKAIGEGAVGWDKPIGDEHPQAGAATSTCEDKFKNCRVVVQARLCRYSYYKEVCCFSCISHVSHETVVDTRAT